MIQVAQLREPELEFGGSMRHLDIRFGLMDYGPFDSTQDGAPRRVRIGIVGDHDTVEGTASWLDRCHGGLPAQRSRQPNLFPPFPGTGEDSPFRCEFTAPVELQRFLSPRDIRRLVAIVDQGTAIREIVSALVAEIRVLVERNAPPDVILCALPLNIVEKAVNASEDEDEDHAEEDGDEPAVINLRGLLKAIAWSYAYLFGCCGQPPMIRLSESRAS